MPSRREFMKQSVALAGGMLLNELPLARAADATFDWGQFLGPRRDCISRETGLNTDWAAKKPTVVWKASLGAGYSSVAVIDDRLYTMSERTSRDFVVCCEAKTGKEIWAYDAAAGFTDRQRMARGPRSTPTHYDGKLYCLLPQGELVCVNAADGKEVWKVDIFKTSGAKAPSAGGGGGGQGGSGIYGMCGSPLIEGNLAIVQPGGSKDNSVVAFHKDTGKMAWGAGSDAPGYSSAIAITAAGKRQIISYTGKGVLAVEPEKGAVLWQYGITNRFGCNCATPLWSNDLLFVSSAYNTGAAALEIVADGEALKAKEKWRSKALENHFATSVILDGHIYGSHGGLGANMLRCVELATGKIKWDERRTGKCALLAYEGHLVVLSESGALRLVEANPEKFVLKGELDGLLEHKAWAAPALLNKRLFVRDDKQLICLDVSKA